MKRLAPFFVVLVFALRLPVAADTLEDAEKLLAGTKEMQAKLIQLQQQLGRVVQMAQWARSRGQRDQFQKYYQMYRQLKPRFDSSALAYRQQAVKAAAAFAEATREHPKSARAHHLHGQALGMTGKVEEALAAYDRALALDSKGVEVRRQRAVLLYGAMRYDLALADILKVADKVKEDQASRLQIIRATILYNLERFKEALGAIEKVKQFGLPPGEAQEVGRVRQMAAQAVKDFPAELELRKKEEQAGDNPIALIETSKGKIKVELFENQAPNTVANFVVLAEKGFYDGLRVHRIIPHFMAQGGDPISKAGADAPRVGSGGPGYRFEDELGTGHRKHFRGSLSMANSGPNTNGSQFFITHRPTSWLDGKHTVFGRVLSGMDVVYALVKGDLINKVVVERKRKHEYAVKKLEGNE